jgi:HAD superfamily phosphoserine phosphatase-like hydrolase
MSKPVIHIFDLDRTITRFPTYTPFLLHAAQERAPWRLLLFPLILPFLLGYVLKLVNRKLLKQVMHSVMLGRHVPRADIECIAESFARKIESDGIFTDIGNIISTAQSSDERIMIATASHRFYVEAIARKIGIKEIIATGSVWQGEYLSPKIPGENCYADAKLRMIVAHFAEQKIERSRHHIIFYSDHISDLPSFEWSDEPIAKNASSALHALALERGWQML